MLLMAPAEERLINLLAERHVTFGEEKIIMARLEALARRRGDTKVRKTDVNHAFWERTRKPTEQEEAPRTACAECGAPFTADGQLTCLCLPF